MAGPDALTRTTTFLFGIEATAEEGGGGGGANRTTFQRSTAQELG